MAQANFGDKDSLFDFVVKKGNGVKGMLDSGLSEVPECYILPPKERIKKQNASVLDQPAFDLSELDGPNHDQVVEQIVRAAETLGFFQVVNHGVPADLLERLKVVAHEFFNQAPEKKALYLKGVSPSPHIKYGTSFAPKKEKTLEWKDYIHMFYTSDADALNYWPDEFKKEILEYLKSSMVMVKKLVKALMEGLGVNVDDSRIETLVGSKDVRINFYPACPNPEKTVGVKHHSDMGILTVLLQDEIGGLYVKVEGDSKAEEQWVEIPPIPNALVINVGDTLQVLSNGRYKSAEHTVRTSNKSRVSVPLFVLPKPSEKIGPLGEVVAKDGVARYREYVLQDYMNNFFGNAHQGKKSLDFATIASP